MSGTENNTDQTSFEGEHAKKQLIEKSRVTIENDGLTLDIAAIHRPGSLTVNASDDSLCNAPIVFLHGFGSTKEDYADIVFHDEFNEHPFLAFDAPGCGETQCGDDSEQDLNQINIPFLVNTALKMLEAFNIEQFHLVGHSMGGLTALMLAHQIPDRVLSFVDIEGNIAPEDCFLSRQIVSHNTKDPETFFHAFIERTRHSPAHSSALYAASLQHKVRAGAVRGIFESMVDLSDNASLMDKFLGLDCPKTYMYGEQNNNLSYLKHIQENGVVLAEIPHCGHFPMYSNPLKMWSAIHYLQGLS